MMTLSSKVRIFIKHLYESAISITIILGEVSFVHSDKITEIADRIRLVEGIRIQTESPRPVLDRRRNNRI